MGISRELGNWGIGGQPYAHLQFHNSPIPQFPIKNKTMKNEERGIETLEVWKMAMQLGEIVYKL